MNYPRVSIVIVNWNGASDTVECLESLQKIVYPSHDVVVVDNGSSGDDVHVLRAKFSDHVAVIQNDRNYGFAEGSNIGMRHALKAYNPAYLLLLNNDTVVGPGFLNELVAAAEDDHSIGILGPKILYHDHDGRSDAVWFTGGGIRWWHPKIWRFLDLGGQGPKRISVDWVSGAAMLIRVSMIDRVSLLDSGYFFSHEDIDYCLRARRHHFKVVYVPTSVIWHKVGRSRSMADPAYANLRLEYRLIKRNASAPVYVYHLLLLPLVLLKWGFSFLTKRKYRNRETLRSFLSNLRPAGGTPRSSSG
jgi:GT2 family glycosyltransferase